MYTYIHVYTHIYIYIVYVNICMYVYIYICMCARVGSLFGGYWTSYEEFWPWLTSQKLASARLLKGRPDLFAPRLFADSALRRGALLVHQG